MDREAWRAAIHGVAKSRIWLSDWTELKPMKKGAAVCPGWEVAELEWKLGSLSYLLIPDHIYFLIFT